MKTLTFALGATILTAAGAFADTTRDSVDWEGRYVGTLPCASCPGIDTTLILNEAGFYTLEEVYLEEKDGALTTEGKFEWNADGTRITLDENGDKRVYAIGEGKAWGVGADGAPNEDYVLHQLIEFNGDGQQLLVDPETMEKDGDKLEFEGLMNFEHRTEAGHKSLHAEFVIDCEKGEVDMPAVAYFKDHDGRGDIVQSVEDNSGNWQPLSDSEDDVLAQMGRAHCAD